MAKKLTPLFIIIVTVLIFAISYWIAIDLMANNDALIARFAILAVGMAPTFMYLQHLYDNWRWAKPISRGKMK